MSLVPAVADEALMQRYRDGDVTALHSLFVRHARRLQVFFLCLLQQPEQAEQLAEQTWQRLHRARRSYLPQQPFVPFLYSFAVQLRRDSVRQPVVTASQPGAARAVTNAESLLRALRDLPDSYREVVVLHRLVQLDYPAIAQVLGATESAVQQRAQQGYEQLADNTAVEKPAEGAQRSQLGEAILDPTLLDAAIEPTRLEHSARALLPLVVRDLVPQRTPWPLYAAFLLLLSVAALVFLRIIR